MNVTEAIKARRSIRGFKPDPIPDDLLRDILEVARFAPSNCNTQPWHLTVVSGEARQRLRQAILDEIAAGKAPSPVFTPGDANLQGPLKDRQYQCAMDYYGVMGIERHERDKRSALAMKNFEFFDAPHVGFISMPADLGPTNAVDVGIFLQTLMLVLVERGLASVPQGALALYPDPVKAIGGVPEGYGIICGLSFGYEDVGARINDAIMGRADIDDIVTLIK